MRQRSYYAAFFTVALGVLGLVAAYDQLSGNGIQEFIRTRALESHLPLLVAALLLVVSAISVGAAEWFGWWEWRRGFRFAGPGSALSYSTISPLSAGSSSIYVPLTRSLEHPPHVYDSSGPTPSIENGAEYLLQNTRDPVRASRRWGFLVAGAPLTGKTRFTVEWIRLHHPSSLVLAPRPDQIPSPNPRLRRFQREGVVLLLDDLSLFSRVATHLVELVTTLREWKVPVLVCATTQNGGSWNRLMTEPEFQRMVEHLDAYLLVTITPEQMRTVGEHLGRPPPAHAEPSFSWLLDEQFATMRLRFCYSLSDAARGILQAASVLHAAGVPYSRERATELAEAMFDLRSHDLSAHALSALTREGFGANPPLTAYLINVALPTVDHSAALQCLEQTLVEREDASALLAWGEFSLADETSGIRGLMLLQRAWEAAAKGQEQGIAALARARAGEFLTRTGQPALGTAMLREAFEAGRTRRDALSVLAAATAGSILASGSTEPAEKVELTEVVLRLATGSQDPRVLWYAAQAALSLGERFALLYKAGHRSSPKLFEQSLAAFDTAVELGRAYSTDAGLEVASRAALVAGALVEFPGKENDAQPYFRTAVELGAKSQLGLLNAVRAGTALANTLWENSTQAEKHERWSEASRLLIEAQDLALKCLAWSERCLENEGRAAATASMFVLGNIYAHIDVRRSELMFLECYRAGRGTEDSIAIASAALASMNLGNRRNTLAQEHGIGVHYTDFYREAIRLGELSGRPDGYLCALYAALHLHHELVQWGALEHAAGARREFCRLYRTHAHTIPHRAPMGAIKDGELTRTWIPEITEFFESLCGSRASC